MILKSLKIVLSVFAKVVLVVMVLFCFVVVYILGVVQGYKLANESAQTQLSMIVEDYIDKYNQIIESQIKKPTPLPTKTPTTIYVTPTPAPSWGGPQLWDAVNRARQSHGVNPLSSRGELCTIASIRLNELLELGTLDNHEGFSNMRERRPDLEWIFEKYSTIAEFLALGGATPQETVEMWENTLGHSTLLTGGEYVWGCIYAQNTFAVAITAY